MSELLTRQWEINGLRMGAGTPYNVYRFEPGGWVGVAKNERTAAAGDGRQFGITTIAGRSVGLSISVDTANIVEATRAYNDLAAVWFDPTVRLVDGARVALRYRPFAGIPSRVMYGRPDPESFDPVNEHLLEVGRVDVEAIFDVEDPLCWADPDSIEPISVGIAPPTEGGWTAPFTAPIVVATTSVGFGSFVLGGTVPAPLIARIHGPITNPVVDYVGRWQYRIATTLLYDQWIDIDARPQHRTVRRSDGVNLGGQVDVDAPTMQDLALRPGPGRIVLRGTDITGTARLTVTPQGAAATPYWI